MTFLRGLFVYWASHSLPRFLLRPVYQCIFGSTRVLRTGLAGLMASSVLLYSQQACSHSDTSPQRIISLAPHITEMVFSAGAGNKLVGVVDYSDFPKEALEIERIGKYNAINIEKIIQINPDLIIAWQSANRPKDIEKLKKLGFKVLFSNPIKLNDIATEIRFFGETLGTQNQANTVAKKLEKQLDTLHHQYQSKARVTAFYQIWNAPLMTINGEQFISQALTLCGAQNVYATLPLLAAEVNIESVIEKNPDTILIGGEKQMQQGWLKDWQRWNTLSAVKNTQLHLLKADTFQRPTQRFIEGLSGLCQTLNTVRESKQQQAN